MPVMIPLWGVVEKDHVHINYHMNFVFHGSSDSGQIIGAAIYPVRDRFQLGKLGGTLNVHGPVRWFDKHSFKPLNGGVSTDSDVDLQLRAAGSSHGPSLFIISAWCVLASLATTLCLVILYLRVIRPRLIHRFMKAE